MAEHNVERGVEDVVRTYELLDEVRRRGHILVRDDQFAFEAMRDAVRLAKRRRARVSVVDTGRLAGPELESLVLEGASIRTSDDVRPRPGEWEALLWAARRSGAFISVLWTGALPSEDGEGAASRTTLEDLLRKGLDLHVSNRARPRDPALLVELAASSRGVFVVYHHGPLAADLLPLARRGAWLHVTDSASGNPGWDELALGIARAASSAGSRAVVRVETGLPLELAERLFAAGAALLFLTPPADEGTPQRSLERRAERRRLPVRAFHLTTAFLP